jgi:hypothetical protein
MIALQDPPAFLFFTVWNYALLVSFFGVASLLSAKYLWYVFSQTFCGMRAQFTDSRSFGQPFQASVLLSSCWLYIIAGADFFWL